MIGTPPEILLLEAVKATIAAVDFAEDAGIAGVSVRHRRNRHTRADERPCIAIVFVDDEPFDEQALDLNAWEKLRQLTVDLVGDMELADEDSGLDPTGFLKLSMMMAAAVRAMQTSGSPISLLTERVSRREINPDEESKEDAGRLVNTILLTYRVRVDNETELLAEGVNA